MSKRGYLKGCAVTACVLGLLLLYGGCIVDLHGNGKVGFEHSSSWTLIHETEVAVPEQKSKSQWLFGPLVDAAKGLHDIFVPKNDDPPEDEGSPPAPDEG